MSGDKTIQDEAKDLLIALQTMVAYQEENANAWLQTLHQHYSNRFSEDNEKIWTAGSIMIPVSLAAIAAYVGLENPTKWDGVLLGAGSTILLGLWVLIAENHRRFQDKSKAWLDAIGQIIMLVNTGGPKIGDTVSSHPDEHLLS